MFIEPRGPDGIIAVLILAPKAIVRIHPNYAEAMRLPEYQGYFIGFGIAVGTFPNRVNMNYSCGNCRFKRQKVWGENADRYFPGCRGNNEMD